MIVSFLVISESPFIDLQMGVNNELPQERPPDVSPLLKGATYCQKTEHNGRLPSASGSALVVEGSYLQYIWDPPTAHSSKIMGP